MKKEIVKSFTFFALPIFLMNLVSAISPSDFLYNIDSRTINTIVAFIIVFTMVFFILKKTFNDNKGVPIAIAAVIALFVAYYVNKLSANSYFNFGGYGYTDPYTKIFYVILIIFLIEVAAGFMKSKSAAKKSSKLDWESLVIGDVIAMALGIAAAWIWIDSSNYGIGTSEISALVMGIISLAIILFYNPEK